MTVAEQKKRLSEIDAAKGLAIILVVIGHLVMREQPLGNEWYKQLRASIYAFHMPFFMYLGGFVMFYTRAAFVKKEVYFDFLKKRAYRLLVPFFFMAFVIFFGKTGASLFISVDNTPKEFWNGLLAIFWNTHDSPAISLWYIFVAFIYALIIPPALWLLKDRILPLLAAAAILYALPLPEYMYLDKIGQYFVFFVLGGYIATQFEKYQTMLDQWKWLAWLAFATSLSITFLDWNWAITMAIVGTLSIPAIHALVRIPKLANSQILLFFGQYSFVIYLFNTIMIGLAKGVMFKFMTWHGVNFLVFVPVLLSAGLIAPILLKKIVFKQIPVIDKLTM